ncbi:hypothetical protein D3C79_820580 [compost metagenome]
MLPAALTVDCSALSWPPSLTSMPWASAPWVMTLACLRIAELGALLTSTPWAPMPLVLATLLSACNWPPRSACKAAELSPWVRMLESLSSRVALRPSLKLRLTRAPLALAPRVSIVTLLASSETLPGFGPPMPAYRPIERSPSVFTETPLSCMLPPSSTAAP